MRNEIWNNVTKRYEKVFNKNKINVFIDSKTKNIVGRNSAGNMIPIKVITVSSEYNYDNVLNVVGENNIPELAEWHVYGNEQQGRFLTIYPYNPSNPNINYSDIVRYGEKPSLDIQNDIFARELGNKSYELKDHLGNVRVTFSDIKMPTGTPAQPFEVDLLSKSEYYPYGMKINDLSYNATGARYGYNSQEQSTELNLYGNHTTAEFWEYDARSTRRWNNEPNPVTGISPYATFQGNHIMFSDTRGDTIKSDLQSAKYLKEGLVASLGENQPFQFNTDSGIWSVNSFDKSKYNPTQLDLINRINFVINSEKVVKTSFKDKNEIFNYNWGDKETTMSTIVKNGAYGLSDPVGINNKQFKQILTFGNIESVNVLLSSEENPDGGFGLTILHEIGGHTFYYLASPKLSMIQNLALSSLFEDNLRLIYRVPVNNWDRFFNMLNPFTLPFDQNSTKIIGGHSIYHNDKEEEILYGK